MHRMAKTRFVFKFNLLVIVVYKYNIIVHDHRTSSQLPNPFPVLPEGDKFVNDPLFLRNFIALPSGVLVELGLGVEPIKILQRAVFSESL